MNGFSWTREGSRVSTPPERPVSTPSDRAPVRSRHPFVAWLACVLFLAPGFASASAAPSGSTTWAYGGGCTLRLDPRPGLSITSTGYPSETPLLTIRPGSSRDSARRRRQDPEIFSIALYEGIENGHRGFSQFADDDNA